MRCLVNKMGPENERKLCCVSLCKVDFVQCLAACCAARTKLSAQLAGSVSEIPVKGSSITQ